MNACMTCNKPLCSDYILIDSQHPLYFCSEECRSEKVSDEDYAKKLKANIAFWSFDEYFLCHNCGESSSAGVFLFHAQAFMCSHCVDEYEEREGDLEDAFSVPRIKDFVRFNGSAKWYPLMLNE